MDFNDEVIAMICDAWKANFPDKPQPQRRAGSSIMKKLKTRWSEPEFRDLWREAIETSAKRKCLHSLSWFTFDFLVKNDVNASKMARDWMAWKDEADNQEREKEAKAEEREARAMFNSPRDFETTFKTWLQAAEKKTGEAREQVIAKAAKNYNAAFARRIKKQLKQG